MADQNPDIRRKLTTIFCADVQGYSALVERDEVGTVTRLKQFREIMIDMIQRHHGRVINTWGDGLLAEFASPVEAVLSAVETQRRLAVRNDDEPGIPAMQFRIGINLGDVMLDGDDIYGEGVNIAARLQTLAEPGGICISGTVFEQVRKRLDFGFDFIGDRDIKNIAEPVPTYRVLVGKGHIGISMSPHAEPSGGPAPASRDTEAAFARWRQQAWRVGAITIFLLIINLVTSPRHLWFFWPALGFGLFLALRFPSSIDPRRLWPSKRD